MNYPWWTLLLLPYTRRELPGWGWLMSRAGVQVPIGSDRWQAAPTRVVRGKVHGYAMRLDLRDWAERMTFFLGRYYELHVQLLLPQLLREGDRFVDIGANVGMITLAAARLVGLRGRIDCFEPNPTCLAALEEHVRLNGLEQVTIHPVALSDAPGRLTLSLTSDHTGTATLAAVEHATAAFEVSVAVGDELLGAERPIRALKIDVEGFELRVLRGLARTLDRDKPALITEFIEAQFVLAGTTGAEIAALLRSHGYEPFGIGTRRAGLQHVLALHPLHERSPENDVLWLHVDDTRRGQLASAIRGEGR